MPQSLAGVRIPVVTLIVLLATGGASALAQSPQTSDDAATRYMALGDSIAAGFRVTPVTQAYPFLLYQNGAFDRAPHTLFVNAAVPGAASRDVLLHQVPQALIPASDGGFNPQFITITVGGNDLLAIMRYALTHSEPETLAYAQGVLAQFGGNLGGILWHLRTGLPNAEIYVSNQYTIPELEALIPVTATLIAAFNNIVGQVVGQFPERVHLVDVFSAFQGRDSVLLIERHGTSPTEVHPTTLGQRVIAQAFAAAIQ